MASTIQVTAAQLIIALVGAAAIGATISAVVSELGQWRERRSRRQELLLQISSDFAKALFEHPNSGLGFAHVALVGQFYGLLDEVLRKGKYSALTEERLNEMLKVLERDKKTAPGR